MDEERSPDLQDVEIRSHDFSLCNRTTCSIVHGFYAAMGGFVIELDAMTACNLSRTYNRRQRFTLTPRGVLLLSRCGLLPKVSREEIEDKSKADALAKSFVCLQAGWMIVQVLGRVKAGLPVTLLEVNTIGHIVCAFAIYLLWWYEPRLVAEPTRLEGDAISAVCTFMWMSSRISDPNKIPQYPFFAPRRFAEFTRLAFYRSGAASGNSDEILYSQLDFEQRRRSCDDESDVSPRRSLGGSKNSRRLQANKGGFGYLESRIGDMGSDVDLPPKRWHLALDAMNLFPAILERAHPDITSPKPQSLRIQCEELLTKHSSNWPSEGLLRGLPGLLMGMALWFVTIAYGAVHVAAWNGFFPSLLEKWLWRASSLYIIWSGLLWLSINELGQMFPTFNNYWEGLLARKGSKLVYVILGFLCAVFGMAYGFARVYLVVESVISLRLLPAGAYQSP